MLDGKPTSFELFAGAGGLALGTELAGFKSLGTIEWDKWACGTMLENQRNAYPLVQGWDVHCMDVRDFDWTSIGEEVDLLAGGPPCQPFSIGGRGRANDDMRDMFPAMIAAVHVLKPRAFVVENVKGLLRSQFSDYYQYILLRLEFPERPIRPRESWVDHLRRLQKAKTSGDAFFGELTYNVVPTLVNAADYGVPQRRERVFIVGFRSDLGIEWSFPNPTHSLAALKWAQREGGEYWARHGIVRPASHPHIAKKPSGGTLPWVTVRDALHGLPAPIEGGTDAVFNHELRTGAKQYPGHTGSSLDMPSKTLKAGVHGVPGGENMLIGDDGTPRYYSVREAARMQTFPDGYMLNGSWTEAMRQLGNAVPVKLAQIVTSSVAQAIIGNEMAFRAAQVRKLGTRWAM
ncbi:MAG: DNA cytosine methyltransferase [Eggerthellaceae bacterium]|nr:DNA cytosine methyltransferase [Eggerthellaceae bacterium]